MGVNTTEKRVFIGVATEANDYDNVDTGGERLIRSHSSARFSFELSGNLN